MPRPRKTPTSRLSHQVAFRLTEDEFAALRELAQAAGVRPGELVRRLVRQCEGRVVIKTTSQMDPAFIAQIRRIGQNLNTLTKNAHIFKRVSPQVEVLAKEIHRLVLTAVEERGGE